MKLIALDEKPEKRAKKWIIFYSFGASYGEIAGGQLFDEAYED